MVGGKAASPGRHMPNAHGQQALWSTQHSTGCSRQHSSDRNVGELRREHTQLQEVRGCKL